MSKLERLIGKVEAAKSELQMYLEPILGELGFTGGRVSCVYLNHDGDVVVERAGSFRGCSWDDERVFPLSIFNAKDPLIAAREYAAETQKRKDDEALARIDRELAVLQKKREAFGK